MRLMRSCCACSNQSSSAHTWLCLSGSLSQNPHIQTPKLTFFRLWFSLRTYSDSIGITYYLVDQLQTAFEPAEVEFYWAQFW